LDALKALYAETKETLDYLEISGSKREKAQAILIKNVALGSCFEGIFPLLSDN